MKTVLIALLLSFGPVAMADSVLQTRFVDNGKMLSIQINGHRDGRKIHFDRTFDVSGQNILQKEMIKYRAFRAVGLMPPLGELPGLVALALGLVVLAGTVLVMRFQKIKMVVHNPI